jgi:hypothetical protein
MMMNMSRPVDSKASDIKIRPAASIVGLSALKHTRQWSVPLRQPHLCSTETIINSTMHNKKPAGEETKTKYKYITTANAALVPSSFSPYLAAACSCETMVGSPHAAQKKRKVRSGEMNAFLVVILLCCNFTRLVHNKLPGRAALYTKPPPAGILHQATHQRYASVPAKIDSAINCENNKNLQPGSGELFKNALFKRTLPPRNTGVAVSPAKK